MTDCCSSRHGQNRPMHKQDGPWSWLVLGCAFLQSWIFIGQMRAHGIFLPVLMEEFDEGRDKIGKHPELTLEFNRVCVCFTLIS